MPVENYTIIVTYDELYLLGRMIIKTSPDFNAQDAKCGKRILAVLEKCEYLHQQKMSDSLKKNPHNSELDL